MWGGGATPPPNSPFQLIPDILCKHICHFVISYSQGSGRKTIQEILNKQSVLRKEKQTIKPMLSLFHTPRNCMLLKHHMKFIDMNY